MRIVSVILFAALFQSFSFAERTHEEAGKNGMQETLQNYIEHNSIIADICVFEQTWIPPSAKSSKGRLILRAVVTNVYSGTIRIGDRIEYADYIEDAPRFFDSFTSAVAGDLRTFFYDPDASEKVVDGWLKIQGEGHWGFSRVGGVFAELFALELKTNPKLKPKSEQGGATNPAKSDG